MGRWNSLVEDKTKRDIVLVNLKRIKAPSCYCKLCVVLSGAKPDFAKVAEMDHIESAVLEILEREK